MLGWRSPHRPVWPQPQVQKGTLHSGSWRFDVSRLEGCRLCVCLGVSPAAEHWRNMEHRLEKSSAIFRQHLEEEEDGGVRGEHHYPAAQHSQSCLLGFQLHNATRAVCWVSSK